MVQLQFLITHTLHHNTCYNHSNGIRVCVSSPLGFGNLHQEGCLPRTIVGMYDTASQVIYCFVILQIPMAVATSSQQASTEAKISNHKDVFSKFHHITTGSHPDIKKGKPAPDIFLICADLFQDKVAPESCLVFEDAPSGVEAAIAAGMQVVAIPDKRVNTDIMPNATQILYSMAHFKPEEFGLPRFEE